MTTNLAKEKVLEQVIERKNEFERRGDLTILKRAYDPTYLQNSFSIKDNLYGAKINTSEMLENDTQPNERFKKKIRLQFSKEGTRKDKVAAGTPTRSRLSENLHKMP